VHLEGLAASFGGKRIALIHFRKYELKNTFLLQYVGSAAVETRVAMGMLALDNIDSVLEDLLRLSQLSSDGSYWH
jgi:lactate dehydrogenase-like 2-hydroxyacid dehydrogenase